MTNLKTNKPKTIKVVIDPADTKLPRLIKKPKSGRYINYLRKLFHGYGFHQAASFTDGGVLRTLVEVRKLQWKLFIPPEVALFYVLAGHTKEPR